MSHRALSLANQLLNPTWCMSSANQDTLSGAVWSTNWKGVNQPQFNVASDSEQKLREPWLQLSWGKTDDRLHWRLCGERRTSVKMRKKIAKRATTLHFSTRFRKVAYEWVQHWEHPAQRSLSLQPLRKVEEPNKSPAGHECCDLDN